MFTVMTVNRKAVVRVRKSFTEISDAIDYARRLASGRRPPLFVNIWNGAKCVWTALSGRELLY